VIRFRFELYPLDEVSPRGGDQPTLHWFGLTEGWYWLEVDGHQLLRRVGREQSHPYVDYYLARLWQDINILTPDVIEPVPTDLQLFVASDPARWACDPLDFVTAADEDAVGDIDPSAPDHPVVTAMIWYGQHNLDLGYLRNAPRLRFWRAVSGDRDEITVDWRHNEDSEIRFTAGSAAQFRVPTAASLDAVHTLDRELMAAMRHRVEKLERRGGLPGVDLDPAWLRRDHEDRTHWLARNLDRRPETDWDASVRAPNSCSTTRNRAAPRRRRSRPNELIPRAR
jgi:hypothetical protein